LRKRITTLDYWNVSGRNNPNIGTIIDTGARCAVVLVCIADIRARSCCIAANRLKGTELIQVNAYVPARLGDRLNQIRTVWSPSCQHVPRPLRLYNRPKWMPRASKRNCWLA